MVCGLWFVVFVVCGPSPYLGGPPGRVPPAGGAAGAARPGRTPSPSAATRGYCENDRFLCETLAAFSFKSQRVKMFRDLAIINSKNHCRQEVILENRCTRILEIHSDCHSRHGVTISNATVSIYPYLREGVGEVNRQVGGRVHLHLGCEPP